MGSSKLRILIPAVLAFFALPAVAHDTATGMHISTKSPQAHVFFEKGIARMEMLHIEDGLQNFRNAVKADPQFALGHIILMFFTQDPTEKVAELDKALATRANSNAEERLIIDWLANQAQSHWIPAIQAMNEALDKYPNDKHLHWLAGWWLLVDHNQSQRPLPSLKRSCRSTPSLPTPTTKPPTAMPAWETLTRHSPTSSATRSWSPTSPTRRIPSRRSRAWQAALKKR